MLTLALHHDESVFVYLSETQKGKKSIEQLGLFSPGFSFDRSFINQDNASSALSEMLKEILSVVSVQKQSLYFSFPADLTYISLQDDVPKEKIKAVVDKDVWLTELKFGQGLIEQSDCQVKVFHKSNDLALLTSIYYPKKIFELIRSACEDNHCHLVGLGINIFNATEVAKRSTKATEYILIGLKKGEYELVNVKDDNIIGYTRFSYINGHLLYFARNGNIPDGLCEAVVNKDVTVLQQYEIFLTGSSVFLHDMYDLKKVQSTIRILNPMMLSTSYSKPPVAYDEQYDTVFSSALGALI